MYKNFGAALPNYMLKKGVLALAFIVLLCPVSASATVGQNDPDPNNTCPNIVCGSNNSAKQDDRYKNLKLGGEMKWVDNTKPFNATGNETVDTGVQGSMPDTSTNPMPTKDTSTMSLVYSAPWLWKDVDFGVRSQVYNGMGASTLNTALNGATEINIDQKDFSNQDENLNPSSDSANANMINEQAVDQTTTSNPLECSPITLRGCGHKAQTYELWRRLDDDSCTNQFILPSALQTSIFSTQFRNYQQLWNESMCQPLKLSPPKCVMDLMNGNKCKKDNGSSDKNLYDYRAWGYLERAWGDVLGTQVYQLVDGKETGNAGHAPVLSGVGGNIKGPGLPTTGQKALGQPFNSATPGYGAGYTVTPNYGIGYGSSGGATGTGKMLSLADIAKIPFERIIDPTHPFSPRWDWKGYDRDYSSATRNPTPVLTGVPYIGYDAVPVGQPTPCIVRCAALPVDIMSFRAQEFDACMNKRIQLNQTCFWTQVQWLMTPMPDPPCNPGVYDMATAIQMTIHDTPPDQCHALYSAFTMCKTYYARKGNWPVCSTKYDHPADGDNPDYCKSARTIIGDPSPPSKGVKKCCDDLAQALTPINTLKIRNTDKRLDPKQILDPDGKSIPAGYRYSDYFVGTTNTNVVSSAELAKYPKGVPQLPFMRWWDTGSSAGGNNNDATRNYDPNCDLGYSDVIIGVGVEGHSCKYGGTGTTDITYSNCLKIPALDPLTSWEELKYYQLQSIRNYGLNCIVQYEKEFKYLGAEDGASLAAGGNAFFAAQVTTGNSSSNPGSGTVSGYENQKVDWRLAWRGYLDAQKASERFPCFGSSSSCTLPTSSGGGGYTGPGNIKGGLDKAQPGDIIYLYAEDMKNMCNFAPPFIGVVEAVGNDTNSNGASNNFVKVIEMNNGKHPDVCGNTTFLGNGQERTIYQSCIPVTVASIFYPAGTSTACGTTTNTAGDTPSINSNGSCADPLSSVCTFNTSPSPPPYGGTCTKTITNVWNNFRIYRPCADVRDGSNSNQCPPASTKTTPPPVAR